MIGVQGSTTFVSRAAVEVWDAQFRWRDGHLIRDRVVDDTWRRVAKAAAAAEGAAVDAWAMRFSAAFRAWRVLPDPGVLRFAGTGTQPAEQAVCTTTVNVLAFVRTGPDGGRTFDATAFRSAAALALRLADDETFLWAGQTRPEPRVGLMGLCDALDALGLPCGSERAARFSGDVAELLALGCLRGNLQLGMERGSAVVRDLGSQWESRGIARLHRAMLRHPIATRLQSQIELAILANGAVRMCGPACGVAWGPDAEARLRRAMQPWIDDTIDCDLIPPTAKASP